MCRKTFKASLDCWRKEFTEKHQIKCVNKWTKVTERNLAMIPQITLNCLRSKSPLNRNRKYHEGWYTNHLKSKGKQLEQFVEIQGDFVMMLLSSATATSLRVIFSSCCCTLPNKKSISISPLQLQTARNSNSISARCLFCQITGELNSLIYWINFVLSR